MTILRPNPLDTVAPIPEKGHGGDPGPGPGGRVRQDPVLPVRDPDRPQPRQPVRGVPPHPGRHHGGDTQAGQLTTSALHSTPPERYPLRHCGFSPSRYLSGSVNLNSIIAGIMQIWKDLSHKLKTLSISTTNI